MECVKIPADVRYAVTPATVFLLRHKDYFRKYLYSDLLWVKRAVAIATCISAIKASDGSLPLGGRNQQTPWRFVCPSSPQLCRQPLRYRNVFRQHRADSPPGLSHRSFLSSRLSCPLEYSERRPSFFSGRIR